MPNKPNHTPSFDLTLLPPAQQQFTILSDTHYMLDCGDAPLEFASRRKQSQRAGAALHLAAQIDSDFTVHLGDLIQEYPDTPDFERALDEALHQLEASGLKPHLVAGNHDVGDKADPTMPTHPVTAEILAQYHRRFGPSWYSFSNGPSHYIILNTQIMNTPLGVEQHAWLETELQKHDAKRLFVFLHLPPYLCAPAEPHRGHYDNLGQPDRTWLLQLLSLHRVERLFAGHVHFAFCDRLGSLQYTIVPSTSFTRPGFGHLFTSAPAPEQGRDDAPKLGFYLCRVFDKRSDLHLIRTAGNTNFTATQLITRTPAALQGAALALTLTHPLCPTAEVPLAWPSVIRQRVRNDYPLLAVQEIGATSVRVPWTDIEDTLQRERLQYLRAEGIAVQAFVPFDDALDLHHLLDHYPDCADRWEVQTAGEPMPDTTCLDLLADCSRRTPLSLSTIVPGERIADKQHPRTRLGFRLQELATLNELLTDRDLILDSALCRIDAEDDPWTTVQRFRALPPLSHIRRVDWLLTLTSRDDNAHARLATEALFATALLPDAQLYVDPILDLDRTMDIAHGVLDGLCNPRPIFHALRCLNTLLYTHRKAWVPEEREEKGVRILALRSEEHVLELLLPEEPVGWTSASQRIYDLAAGTVAVDTDKVLIAGPSLVYA